MVRDIRMEKSLARDGVAALFRTRAETDVAIEHLVQEHGIESYFIYAEPVGEENSAGTRVSGGDHASAMPSHMNRRDAPLHGVIQLTVLMRHQHLSCIEESLQSIVMKDMQDCGAVTVEAF